jgi:hypothetical protein
MPSMLPSIEAQRLQIVQRAARFVCAVASAPEPFDAWGIFPPDLAGVESGTAEYSWRGQLAWTWARAGYFKDGVTGKGTRKHRTYTLTPLGRTSLERVAVEPGLAAFYISNKRTTSDTNAQNALHYQPPELRKLPTLRSVPHVHEDLSIPDAEIEEEVEDGAEVGAEVGDGAEESSIESTQIFRAKSFVVQRFTLASGEPYWRVRFTLPSGSRPWAAARFTSEALAREWAAPQIVAVLIKGRALEAGGEESGGEESGTEDQLARFNAFIEQVTGVLENMNAKLVAIESDRTSTRLQTLEYEVHGFTDLMLSVADRLDKVTSSTDAALATRGDLGKVSAELAKAFSSAPRPDSKSVTPKLDEAALASGLGEVLRASLVKEMDARMTAQFEGVIPILRAAVREESMRDEGGLADKLAEGKLAEVLRAGVREEVAAQLKKIDFKVDLSGFGKKLEDSIAKRFETVLANDGESVREAAESLTEDLSLIRKSTEKLGVSVADLLDAYKEEHSSFMATGERVALVLTNASKSALAILDASKVVANEMMSLASTYAQKSGVPRDVAFARTDAALAAFSEAEERLIAGTGNFGSSLIMAPKTIDAKNLRPIIMKPKGDDE